MNSKNFKIFFWFTWDLINWEEKKLISLDVENFFLKGKFQLNFLWNKFFVWWSLEHFSWVFKTKGKIHSEGDFLNFDKARTRLSKVPILIRVIRFFLQSYDRFFRPSLDNFLFYFFQITNKFFHVFLLVCWNSFPKEFFWRNQNALKKITKTI